MEQHSVRKTYKYRLVPTPGQERVLETVLLRCRMLYNVALEQRKTWWERGQGIAPTYYQQKRELPDLKAGCPEYAEIHAHVLQDVILQNMGQKAPRLEPGDEWPLRLAGFVPRCENGWEDILHLANSILFGRSVVSRSHG